MKNNYYDKRLKKLFYKNYVFFSIISVIPVLLLFLLFAQYISFSYNDRMEALNEMLVTKYMETCDTMIQEVEKYAISLSINDKVVLYSMSAAEESDVLQIQQYLNFYKNINNAIDEVYVYNIDNGGIVNSQEETTYEAIKEEINFENNPVILDSATKIELCVKNNGYPYVMRVVRMLYLNGCRTAVIVDLNVDSFGRYLHSEYANYGISLNSAFIVSPEGQIIYGSQLGEQFLQPVAQYMQVRPAHNRVVMKNVLHIACEVDSQYSNCSYISLIPLYGKSAFTLPYVMLLIAVLLFFCFMGMLGAFLMSRRAISPIYMILSEIDQESIREQKIPLDVKYIISDILQTAKQHDDINMSYGARMVLLKLANIQSLENQINPHFLYNTLDMINWAAFKKLGKNNEVSETLTELSNLYRVCHSNYESIVRFKEEIDYLQHYIRLLNKRYKNIIDFHLEYEPQCMQLDTVKFILQPLVENVVNHGFKSKKEIIGIWVHAFVEEQVFVIEVSDNGCGMPENVIDEMNKEFVNSVNDLEHQLRKIIIDWNAIEDVKETKHYVRKLGDKGTALKNINNRIMLIFGKKYGLHLSLNEYGGLKVTINMPIMTEKNEKQL